MFVVPPMFSLCTQASFFVGLSWLLSRISNQSIVSIQEDNSRRPSLGYRAFRCYSILIKIGGLVITNIQKIKMKKQIIASHFRHIFMHLWSWISMPHDTCCGKPVMKWCLSRCFQKLWKQLHLFELVTLKTTLLLFSKTLKTTKTESFHNGF